MSGEQYTPDDAGRAAAYDEAQRRLGSAHRADTLVVRDAAVYAVTGAAVDERLVTLAELAELGLLRDDVTADDPAAGRPPLQRLLVDAAVEWATLRGRLAAVRPERVLQAERRLCELAARWQQATVEPEPDPDGD